MSALQSNAARVVPVRPSTTSTVQESQPKPKLKLVEAPAQERSAFRFMLLCIAIVTAAIIGALLLNTEMANGAYERSRLQKQLSEEVIAGEQLSEQLADLSTAENLAKKAKKLGMVQDVNPEVLHIDSAKIANEKATEELRN